MTTAVDRNDYRMAAALCNIEFERLYHLLGMLGMKEEAAQVQAVDKGQLIARIATLGCGADFTAGEVLVLVLVCLAETGASHAIFEQIRRQLREAQGQQATQDILQRMREGAKP